MYSLGFISNFIHFIITTISMYSGGFRKLDAGLEQPVANWVKLCVSLGGSGKKVYPVALTPGSRVQRRAPPQQPHPLLGVTKGPGSHSSEYIYHDSTPRAGDLQAHYHSLSHLQASYSSHSLFFPPTSSRSHIVPALSQGYIGGNDPK